ncbi:uncharacterized protein LOC143217560 [Lasioglossum baleicum]|uniref:uncharacterized protein LOC143217560 n=1 Tax=Lasioglossum baleicum TaxID=434251 RepID=UPI003FCEC243
MTFRCRTTRFGYALHGEEQWLELGTTIARWQPVLSHHRFATTPPGLAPNTDSLSTLSHNVLSSRGFPGPLFRHSRSRFDQLFFCDHISLREILRNTSESSSPRGQRKRVFHWFDGRFRGKVRTRLPPTALPALFAFDPLAVPVFLGQIGRSVFETVSLPSHPLSLLFSGNDGADRDGPARAYFVSCCSELREDQRGSQKNEVSRCRKGLFQRRSRSTLIAGA